MIDTHELKKRDLYLNKIIAFQDTEPVKVVTGIRRCGKSSLLKLMTLHLKETGITDDQILEMNFESYAYKNMTSDSFYEYVKQHIVPNKRMYFFFDEVQRVPDWEDAVNSFRVDFNCDIYVTGSNAYMLSSEYATYLSGRCIEIKMLPLSFSEFLTFHDFEIRETNSSLGGTRKQAYDKMGEPLIYTKDIPSGNYTSELEGYRMNKFEVAENSYSSSNTDIPVFRYAEIMMMKAECLLRTGKSGAGTLVTQVRQRAFKDNPELATVTDSQLAGNTCYQYGYVEDYKIVDRGNTDPIQFGRMYDELGWEFAWEMHRRRDAIRFGIYTTKSWLSHKPEGDYRSVFPIPETVLTSNPNLEQNPNYL